MRRPPLRLWVLGLLLLAAPASLGAEVRRSWRPLTVRVLSAADGAALAGARLVVEVLGAPVWEEPKEVYAGAGGRAVVWVPRWGGPVVVTAGADAHLPARAEVGPASSLSLRLPALPRTERVRLDLVGAEGQGLPPSAVPRHATLLVRAYGEGPVDETRFATWSLSARAAARDGLSLPAGTNELCLRGAAWVPAWTRVVLPGPSTVRMPRPEPAAYPLLLRVVDAATGSPLAGALVRYRGWGMGQIRTDAEGSVTIPYLPGDELPEALVLDWSLPGWARARWYRPQTRPDGRTEWRLGMHRAPDARVGVREGSGRAADTGVAWSLGGPWPTRRRAIVNGVASIPLPPSGAPVSDLRYAFASTEGFRVVDVEHLRGGTGVTLLPWRAVRVRVDRAGAPCPGTCQVGVHLLDVVIGALDPTGLPPWAWTADVSAAGKVDAVVPEDDGCVLQVDVGRRTAFFRASDLWGDEERVLRVGPEAASAPRTLRLRTVDGEPVSGANVELRWYAPTGRPRPLDLVFRGDTDAEGRFRHYGPAGPYSVVVSHGPGLHAPDVEVRYGSDASFEVTLPPGE